jgi:hypothetical protein
MHARAKINPKGAPCRKQKFPALAGYTRIRRDEPQLAEHETGSSVQGIVKTAKSEASETGYWQS